MGRPSSPTLITSLIHLFLFSAIHLHRQLMIFYILLTWGSPRRRASPWQRFAGRQRAHPQVCSWARRLWRSGWGHRPKNKSRTPTRKLSRPIDTPGSPAHQIWVWRGRGPGRTDPCLRRSCRTRQRLWSHCKWYLECSVASPKFKEKYY